MNEVKNAGSGLVAASLKALEALDHIQRRAVEIGMQGTPAWDDLVGGADLHSVTERLREAIRANVSERSS